jgi:hypothetical protein
MVAGASEEYFVRVRGTESGADVRLTNLVTPTAAGASVFGTDDIDHFEFVPGETTTLTINGVAYDFAVAADETFEVTFEGGKSADTAHVTGTDETDVAVLGMTSGTVSGPGYLATLSETAGITVDAADGADEATLNGSEANEDAEISPDSAELKGLGFQALALNFETVDVDAKGGDSQTVVYHDSAVDNDTLIAAPFYSTFTNAVVDLSAMGFNALEAHGSRTGDDVAKFYDSSDDDTFLTAPSYGLLSNDDFSLKAMLFDEVHAYADHGHDVTKMYDSAGADSL